MTRRRKLVLTALGAFLSSTLLSAMLLGQQGGNGVEGGLAPADESSHGPGDDLARLKAEVASLKTALSTATAMHEVDYHAQNLWFAGAAGNWPLAAYYWDKVLVHMQSTVGANRGEGRDQSAQPIGASIRNRNQREFAVNYRTLLQGCYDCHKAEGKPFLRPRMPMPPAQSIISVSPSETWPK